MPDKPQHFGHLVYNKFQGSNVASGGMVKNGPGVLQGIIVNSHTNGRIRLYDGTLTGTRTAFGGTFALGSCAATVSGAGVLMIEPLAFDTGLFISVDGTLDSTVLYN